MTGSIAGMVQYYGNSRYFDYIKPEAVKQDTKVPVQNTEDAKVTGQTKENNLPSSPIRPVLSSEKSAQEGIPFMRKGADPVEMAVRMRIEYAGDESAAGAEVKGFGDTENGAGIEGVREAFKEGECQTCKERKYQDGSDDPGVSYQTPTRISPERAASAVRSHEMEHVTRESAKAQRENRKVVSQSVMIHTAICPECGKVYVSGGTTRTTTAAKAQPAESEYEQSERVPFSAVA